MRLGVSIFFERASDETTSVIRSLPAYGLVALYTVVILVSVGSSQADSSAWLRMTGTRSLIIASESSDWTVNIANVPCSMPSGAVQLL